MSVIAKMQRGMIDFMLRRVPAGPKPPRCLLPRRRSYDDAIVWEINLGLRRQRQLLPPSAPLPASRARLSTFLTQLHVMGGKGWDPRLPSSTLNPPFTALVVEPTWYTLRGLFFFCVALAHDAIININSLNTVVCIFVEFWPTFKRIS